MGGSKQSKQTGLTSSTHKMKLKTSKEVFDMICTDDQYDSSKCNIVYVDRVLGRRVRHPANTWKPASKDGDVPWHRVWSFEYNGTVFWERESRFFDMQLLRDLAAGLPVNAYRQYIPARTGKAASLRPDFSVATFNILFDLYDQRITNLDLRLPGISQHLRNLNADLILLQECTPKVLIFLQDQEWTKAFHIMHTDLDPYGQITLSKVAPIHTSQHHLSQVKRALKTTFSVSYPAQHTADHPALADQLPSSGCGDDSDPRQTIQADGEGMEDRNEPQAAVPVSNPLSQDDAISTTAKATQYGQTLRVTDAGDDLTVDVMAATERSDHHQQTLNDVTAVQAEIDVWNVHLPTSLFGGVAAKFEDQCRTAGVKSATSEGEGDPRAEQLHQLESLARSSKAAAVMVAGDFNAFGEHTMMPFLPKGSSIPATGHNQIGMRARANAWRDAWVECKGESDLGLTYDPDKNSLASWNSRTGLQARLDRVVLRGDGLKVQDIRLFGNKMKKPLSDHYGLLASMKLHRPVPLSSEAAKPDDTVVCSQSTAADADDECTPSPAALKMWLDHDSHEAETIEPGQGTSRVVQVPVFSKQEHLISPACAASAQLTVQSSAHTLMEWEQLQGTRQPVSADAAGAVPEHMELPQRSKPRRSRRAVQHVDKAHEEGTPALLSSPALECSSDDEVPTEKKPAVHTPVTTVQTEVRQPTPEGKQFPVAIAWVVPPSSWKDINQLREKYDPRMEVWMPHVTIIPPSIPQQMLPHVMNRVTFSDKTAAFDFCCSRLHPQSCHCSCEAQGVDTEVDKSVAGPFGGLINKDMSDADAAPPQTAAVVVGWSSAAGSKSLSNPRVGHFVHRSNCTVFIRPCQCCLQQFRAVYEDMLSTVKPFMTGRSASTAPEEFKPHMTVGKAAKPDAVYANGFSFSEVAADVDALANILPLHSWKVERLCAIVRVPGRAHKVIQRIIRLPGAAPVHLNCVLSALSQHFPHMLFEVVGSHQLEAATDRSDIDLLALGTLEKEEALQQLQVFLETCGLFYGAYIVENKYMKFLRCWTADHVMVDLQYIPWIRHTEERRLDKPPGQMLLQQLMDKLQQPLLRPHATQVQMLLEARLLLQYLGDDKVARFKACLQRAKAWAQQVGIYNASCGYFGGHAWAVATAIIITHQPAASDPESNEDFNHVLAFLAAWDWNHPLSFEAAAQQLQHPSQSDHCESCTHPSDVPMYADCANPSKREEHTDGSYAAAQPSQGGPGRAKTFKELFYQFKDNSRPAQPSMNVPCVAVPASPAARLVVPSTAAVMLLAFTAGQIGAAAAVQRARESLPHRLELKLQSEDEEGVIMAAARLNKQVAKLVMDMDKHCGGIIPQDSWQAADTQDGEDHGGNHEQCWSVHFNSGIQDACAVAEALRQNAGLDDLAVALTFSISTTRR